MHVIFETGPAAVTCRMCGARLARRRLRVTDLEFRPSNLELAECLSCGTLNFAGDDPVIGYDHAGFQADYWHHYVQCGAGIMAMLEPLSRLDVPLAGDLLDIGCGFGFVPHFWQTAGYGRAVGLETSEYGHVGREKLGVEIRHSYYSKEASDLDGRFRYVLSSEVIEHVPNPLAFLREVSTALTSDGILMLTTPSASSIRASTPRAELLASLSPGFHYFVTNAISLRRLLFRAGFRHVRVEDSGSRLFAWASMVALPDLLPADSIPPGYLDYLELLTENPEPHVSGGALYRLFKDAHNTGRHDLASRTLPRLMDLARSAYGINLDDAGFLAGELTARWTVKDVANRPAWLGTCRYVLAEHRLQSGEVPAAVIGQLIRAIAEMGQQVRDQQQFAQEAAFFRPAARARLVELLRRPSVAQADEADLSACRAEVTRLLSLRRVVEAEAELWRAIAAAPDHFDMPVLWHDLGRIMRQTGDAETAAACLNAAVALAPESADLWNEMGLTSFDAGKYHAARERFRLAVNAAPEHAVAWGNLALTCATLEVPLPARLSAREALRLDPASETARIALVRSLITLENYTEAVVEAETLLRLDPKDAITAQLLHALAVAWAGDVEWGLYTIAELAETQPGDVRVTEAFAAAYAAFGLVPRKTRLLPFLDGLDLSPKIRPGRGARRAPAFEIGIVVAPGAEGLAACLESVRTYSGLPADEVTLIAPYHPAGSPQLALALAEVPDTLRPQRILRSLNDAAALKAGHLLVLSSRARLLPGTIQRLVDTARQAPWAAVVAALPLTGVACAHPLPQDTQPVEPVPEGVLAEGVWTHGTSTPAPSPLVPSACLLFDRRRMAELGGIALDDFQSIEGALGDYTLRASCSGCLAVLSSGAPVATTSDGVLTEADRQALYARHSALRVLVAERLLGTTPALFTVQLGIARDIALPHRIMDDPAPSAPASSAFRWIGAPVDPEPGQKSCIYVAFAPDGAITGMTRHALDEFARAGFQVYLCLVVRDTDAPVDRTLCGATAGLAARGNVGYDFAAWAEVLRRLPRLWQSDTLLFANDSMIGPVAGFAAMIRRLLESSADFVAATDSQMHKRHAQSYFFALRNEGIRSAALRTFWDGLANLASRDDVIRAYELELLEYCEASGLRSEILFSLESMLGPARRAVQAISPTHHLWRLLLRNGFPFVKTALFLNPLPGFCETECLERLAALGADAEAVRLHVQESLLKRRPIET